MGKVEHQVVKSSGFYDWFQGGTWGSGKSTWYHDGFYYHLEGQARPRQPAVGWSIVATSLLPVDDSPADWELDARIISDENLVETSDLSRRLRAAASPSAKIVQIPVGWHGHIEGAQLAALALIESRLQSCPDQACAAAALQALHPRKQVALQSIIKCFSCQLIARIADHEMARASAGNLRRFRETPPASIELGRRYEDRLEVALWWVDDSATNSLANELLRLTKDGWRDSRESAVQSGTISLAKQISERSGDLPPGRIAEALKMDVVADSCVSMLTLAGTPMYRWDADASTRLVEGAILEILKQDIRNSCGVGRSRLAVVDLESMVQIDAVKIGSVAEERLRQRIAAEAEALSGRGFAKKLVNQAADEIAASLQQIVKEHDDAWSVPTVDGLPYVIVRAEGYKFASSAAPNRPSLVTQAQQLFDSKIEWVVLLARSGTVPESVLMPLKR
jgi:hypothetical protein